MADKSAKATSKTAGLNKILAANITQWMKDDCRFVLMFRGSSMKTFYALLFIDVEDSPLWGAELIYQFKLPDNFPQEPPSVECLTPNGQMELGGPICLGIGEWHKDQWRGSLGIVGFVNYVWCCMTNMDQVEHGIRIIKITPPAQLRKFAQESREYNRVDPSTHDIQSEFETKIRDHPNIPAIRALQTMRTRTAETKGGRRSATKTPEAAPKAAAPEAPRTPPPATAPAAAPEVRRMPPPATAPAAAPAAMPTAADRATEMRDEKADAALEDYMAALGL
jgi:ubiquitin-protein ligase